MLNILIADKMVHYIKDRMSHDLQELKNMRKQDPEDFVKAMKWVFEYEPNNYKLIDNLTKGEKS